MQSPDHDYYAKTSTSHGLRAHIVSDIFRSVKIGFCLTGYSFVSTTIVESAFWGFSFQTVRDAFVINGTYVALPVTVLVFSALTVRNIMRESRRP